MLPAAIGTTRRCHAPCARLPAETRCSASSAWWRSPAKSPLPAAPLACELPLVDLATGGQVPVVCGLPQRQCPRNSTGEGARAGWNTGLLSWVDAGWARPPPGEAQKLEKRCPAVHLHRQRSRTRQGGSGANAPCLAGLPVTQSRGPLAEAPNWRYYAAEMGYYDGRSVEAFWVRVKTKPQDYDAACDAGTAKAASCSRRWVISTVGMSCTRRVSRARTR